MLVSSYDAFYSQPVVNGLKFDTLQEILDKTAESLDLDVDKCYISTPSYSEGTFSFKVEETKISFRSFLQYISIIFVTRHTKTIRDSMVLLHMKAIRL